MAIEYDLLLKDKAVSAEVLIEEIEALGYSCDKDKIECLNKVVNINLFEEFGFLIILYSSDQYSYNLWETHFQPDDFVYQNSLTFRFDKFYLEYEKRARIMLKIVFDLAEKLDLEALFIQNGDLDLCCFQGNKKILLNNENGTWDKECFKDAIIGKDVSYV